MSARQEMGARQDQGMRARQAGLRNGRASNSLRSEDRPAGEHGAGVPLEWVTGPFGPKFGSLPGLRSIGLDGRRLRLAMSGYVRIRPDWAARPSVDLGGRCPANVRIRPDSPVCDIFAVTFPTNSDSAGEVGFGGVDGRVGLCIAGYAEAPGICSRVTFQG